MSVAIGTADVGLVERGEIAASIKGFKTLPPRMTCNRNRNVFSFGDAGNGIPSEVQDGADRTENESRKTKFSHGGTGASDGEYR